MQYTNICMVVRSDDLASSNMATNDLMGMLQLEGVEVTRAKESSDTMDLGTVLAIRLVQDFLDSLQKSLQSFFARWSGATIEIRTDKGDILVTGVKSPDAAAIVQAIAASKLFK